MIPAEPHSTASDFAVQLSGEPSAYYQRLHPWCIVCQLPPMRSLIVCRFRKRPEAEAHLKILRQLMPNARYLLVFDAGS
ncbi:MAG: hypothetical protein KME07_21000 [Pegethrix bostrychoides GSE-TBD4-15B]|jgi:hypothetical protein|uniref:Uncharacterized protein n=1 Tax=Pegethrix bostrychoides GSE-TBD4-15B TaxID=2839662 RepID=A0A951U7W7_9CYAN|nr:hypothetical protein [Pegethrix bostrychoides GSE-TBD4-15B]